MKQVASLISTYSSDEFGICSILYELGGMVVMHDASGCNSTYTTHDEPRWYHMDSMIFISAISEMEAIMGDDNKLIDDVTAAAKELNPKFIALVGAPIPYMIGTDLPAIAAVIEGNTGIPSFGFPANGMEDYLIGESMALTALVKRFCVRNQTEPENQVENMLPRVNILGATPLDFSLNQSVETIQEWLVEYGMKPGACMAMGTDLEEIAKAGEAELNLVVSYGGLEAARYLEKEFGTPYVVGVPLGERFSVQLANTVKKTIEDGESRIGYLEGKQEDSQKAVGTPTIAIIGESVYSASLGTAIEMEYKVNTRVLCPLTTEAKLLRTNDCKTPEEDDLMRELQGSDHMVADPLYRRLCPENTIFHELGHEAFSGRICPAKNLVKMKLEQEKDNGK